MKNLNKYQKQINTRKLQINLLLIFIIFTGTANAQIPAKSGIDSNAIAELQEINTKIDSLLQKKHFGQVERLKVDSLINKKKHRLKSLDSLQQLPDRMITHLNDLVKNKVNKLENKFDSLQAKTSGYKDKVEKISGNSSELDAVQPRFDKEADKLKGKANVFSEKGKLERPGVNQDGTNIQIPEDYQQEFERLKGLTDKQLKEVARIKSLKQNADIYRKSVDQTDHLKKEIKENLPGDQGLTENLSRRLEQQAENLEEIEAFKTNTVAFEEKRALAEQLKKEKYLKEKARNQVQQLAKEGLTKFQGKIKDAQKAMGKLKKKYASVHSSSDMSDATKRNALAGKPLSERITVGGNFQILRGNPVAVDLSPVVGYRWTKKLSLGFGGNYRLTLSSENQLSYKVDQNVIGYHGFTEHKLLKGFYFHGSFERLGLMKSSKSEKSKRQWVNGVMAGLGKQYQLTKTIKGSAMLLYNFLHQSDKSPYPSPWRIKMGFHLDNLKSLKKN